MMRASLLLLLVLPSLASAAAPSRRFNIEQTYEVKPAARPITLYVPLPADDPWQRVTGLAIEGARFEEVRDPRHGNAAARFELPASGGRVTVRFTVERWERAADLAGATGQPAPSGYAPQLQPDTFVPLDDRVRRIAGDVTARAKTPLDQARAVYAYVLSTMRYEKPAGPKEGWGKGDILWACDRKYGNCTDFHALFIGLLRASGVPARFQVGYSVPSDGAATELAGYHCWADFYLDGVGWVPVDASEAWKHPDRRDYFFGHHDANRFALSDGRDLSFAGMRGAPLNFFVYPYAEVDGKPYGEIVRHTRYSP
jgi:transglutaminase-like putative cysteine protease